MDNLIRKRASLKGKLTQFTNYLSVPKSCKSLTLLQLTELEVRLSKIEKLYDDFDNLQTEIELQPKADPDEQSEERRQFETLYFEVVSAAKHLQSMSSNPQAEALPTQVSSGTKGRDALTLDKINNFVRLPRIDPPTFDGSYQNWLEFRDTFSSLVHNNSNLDPINKHLYLRSSLKGSATLIISNLECTSENYNIAWQALLDRYDNKRLLVSNHVQGLFNIQQIQRESSHALRTLIDMTKKNLRSLKSLGQPTDTWDTLIIHMTSGKLDSTSLKEWEKFKNNLEDIPNFDVFIKFLSNRADFLESYEETKPTTKKDENRQKSYLASVDHNNKGHGSYKCPMCNLDHFLFTCESFKKLTVESRNKKARESKVCMNCLRPGHYERRCRLAGCKYCNKRHNTMLHLENFKEINSINNVALSADTSSSQNTTSCHVLLSTAIVSVVDSRGRERKARVLLDNGSSGNFVTDAFCAELGLSREGKCSTVSGINTITSKSTQSCHITLQSLNSNYKVDLECSILPQITKTLPASYIDTTNIPIPYGLHLADPTFNVPSAIDILVGAEVFWEVVCLNSIALGANRPKLVETKLGWIVSGPVLQSIPRSNPQCFFTQEIKNELNKFWELDSISPIHSLSHDERLCEEIFDSTTRRDEEGRFIVTMPLKGSVEELGNSYDRARVRFLSLERKFQKDLEYKEKYVKFMEEYLQLGHMSENKYTNKNNNNYYLPHHGVIKEQSSTTKLRVVFDASAATTTGVSLNDLQLIGPTVQDDLFSILTRFRQHKIVISADCEKMFRSVNLEKSQRELTQILFRSDPNQPLKSYTLNTVTYGTASASYLATKCLTSLANESDDVEIQRAISKDFYVDDFLSGMNSEPAALELGKKVASILGTAKFNLRKWQSNSKYVLENINDNKTQDLNSKALNLDGGNNNNKTLGIYWKCNTDILSYSVNEFIDIKSTKRTILSAISQIFDPLGLVGPCVVEIKLLLQDLWKEKSSWDESIPHILKQKWETFKNTIKHLNDLKIPRCVVGNQPSLLEIHTFVDSSESAYGACAYVRSVSSTGKVEVHLLASKNKVAPMKPTTIPRLELCGAVMGARLCAKIKSALTLKINACWFWCDSTIVLGWLSTPASQLKTFVRNRVNEIQETTTGHKWNYVPTGDNPADLVSRGVRADLIGNSALWFTGPKFLLKKESFWPKMPNSCEKQDHTEVISCATDIQTDNQNIFQELIHSHSNITSIQNIITYVFRFIHNCRNKNNKLTGHLTIGELQSSLKCILHNSQMEMFPEEYSLLKVGKPLPKSNRLKSLSPFIDDSDIIRVGGRLDNSPYSFDVKHPVLLDSKHHLTYLIFRKTHIQLMHAGPQLLLANVRQGYWPLGGRNLSKKIVKQCVKCCRFKAQIVQPPMAQLPSHRTELEFPFLHIALDYAGAILIASKAGRGSKVIKSYICIIVCLAVKAVHLELVTDLTKEAFMAALNRFVARRGRPLSITCDNATNFVGASNELNQFLLDSNISSDLAQEGIEFNFVPAYSPHFNGISEAAVKSTKSHLKKVLSLTHLTFEEMYTCLAQIEAILNSRPLTPLSSSPMDLTALTPGHFLIGRSLTSIPHPQVYDVNLNRLQRFTRIEHIKQHFWNRFSQEYVTELQQRTKWHNATGELKLNQLVLVKEKALPPLLWMLGRVTAVHPGTDGVTRVADIKTKKGTIRRAFNNICPLPMDGSTSSSLLS